LEISAYFVVEGRVQITKTLAGHVLKQIKGFLQVNDRNAFEISSSYPSPLFSTFTFLPALNRKIAMSSSEFEDETTAYVPLVLILPIFFRRLATGIIDWECVSSHLPRKLSKLGDCPKDPRSRYWMVTCSLAESLK
jgi:hypothetical protein